MFRKFNKYQSKAAKLCARLQKKGPQTYWVGGAVRDLFLRRENYDIDIATELKPEAVILVLKRLNLPIYSIGEKFGTVGTLIERRTVEITTFRSESDYSDFRHPGRIDFISSARQDAARRDFTINALMFDPNTHELFDFFNGLSDLRAKRLRFVGNAKSRIVEDPLRMLRAIRFAVSLGFRIDPADYAVIKKHSKLIEKISGERVKRELYRILISSAASKGLKLLQDSNLLKYIFLVNIKRKDPAFIHSLKALSYLKKSGLNLRYALLIKNLFLKSPKKSVKKNTGNSKIIFALRAHYKIKDSSLRKIISRLNFTRAEERSIKFLLVGSLLIADIKSTSLEKLVIMAKNKTFFDLVDLRVAENKAGRILGLNTETIKKNNMALSKLRRDALLWQRFFEKPLLRGDEVMCNLKIPTGRKIGEILQQIEIARVQKKIFTKKDALLFLKTIDTLNQR